MSLTDEDLLEALQSAWKTSIDPRDVGIIDIDEWRDSIRRLNSDLNETDIRSAFKCIDKQKSGHIDQTDFIHELIGHKSTTNHPLSSILHCIIPSNNPQQSGQQKQVNDEEKQENEQLKLWKKVFDSTFDGHNTVSQDLWLNTISSLTIESINDDDLCLFHAVMDSRFRSVFDFDEFYETFTIESLHHQEMDDLRETLKHILLPTQAKATCTKPLLKAPSKQVKIKSKPRQKPSKTKKTKEISIQTDKIEHLNKDELEYDQEIEDLEEHIVSEEKYLEIMDTIDEEKKRNYKSFKWENAGLWSVFHVINWLNDIGFKNAEYINKFKENEINGDVLLNALNVERMVNDIEIERDDALRIEKGIYILKNIEDKVLMDVEETKEHNNDGVRYYKKQCEYLNRELKKMGKIETMFKKNRRGTELKVKQLECNLYFGSLSQDHLLQNFDIDQLFKIQAAHNKTLVNIQQAIETKVNNMTEKQNI